MKNRSFGHLKTKLFTIKTSKHVGLGGAHGIYIYTYIIILVMIGNLGNWSPVTLEDSSRHKNSAGLFKPLKNEVLLGSSSRYIQYSTINIYIYT